MTWKPEAQQVFMFAILGINNVCLCTVTQSPKKYKELFFFKHFEMITNRMFSYVTGNPISFFNERIHTL